jgi:PAS domain S-box-containing protein
MEPNESDFRDFAETAAFGLHWVGPDGIVLWVNQAELDMLGYSREEYVGHHISEFHADAPVIEDMLVRLLRGETLRDFPVQLRCKDGSTKHAQVNSSGLFENGVFRHTRCFTVDVTDRLSLQNALEDSERLFREIIDALPAVIYTTDAEGRVTHFNRAAVEFSGRTPELGTDRWCVTWKLFRPDGTPMPHEQCPMAIALKEGRVVLGQEAIAERPDGTRRWFTPYPTPLRNTEGKIIGGINMLLDITDRKLNEQTSNLLAAIVDSSDDAIISKNLDGIITSWNKSAERMFGYSAAEAIGRHITLIIPQERLNEEVDILSRLRRGQQVDHFQTIRRRKNGELVEISVTISPVRDAAGHVIGASKVARDISQQKRAEMALRTSEENFRRLSESLNLEVSNRTRELEQRSADILRQSEMMRELSWQLLRAQDEERRRIARELHDSAGQTLAVLGMSLAQMVQKTGRKAPELVGDAEMIQEAVQQLNREIRTASYLLHPPLLDESGLRSALTWFVQGLVERSGLDVKLDIAKSFGRLPRDMELAAFRVVQECLTNIHRHSGSKTAFIRLDRHPDAIVIEVLDQGQGMSPERLAEIRLQSSGVGIRGIRERLRQFHGSMQIESNPSGTTVVVTIPVTTGTSFEDKKGSEPVSAIN